MESFFVYSILISIGIGVAVGVLYTLLGFWKTWGMGIILAVLIGLTCFVLISRMLARRFEPRFLQAQKQLQSGATLTVKFITLDVLLPEGSVATTFQ